jgi:hypothetical protein
VPLLSVAGEVKWSLPCGCLATGDEEPMLEPRAAAAECLGHFNKHLVCGDAGVVFEPVGPRAVQGAYAHPR